MNNFDFEKIKQRVEDLLEGKAETLFPMGNIVATHKVVREINPVHIGICLDMHSRGKWGAMLCQEDCIANDLALISGGRLLSAYKCLTVDDDGWKRVYVITEADRSYTTILLADEY